MTDLFRPLKDIIADLDDLTLRQRRRWPEYDKASKTPGQSYIPQKQLEDDADADRRDQEI